jgi:hypothetical protein
MNGKSLHREQFIKEFSARLSGKSKQEIETFFIYTLSFVERYASGYELTGPIYLVLDNSLIQAFKHRDAQPRRGVHALSFIAFCRFVTGWSDRPTALAISPMAIYEHLGKARVESVSDSAKVMNDLAGFFAHSNLPMRGIGFSDLQSLIQKLDDIKEDERYLSEYAGRIDSANWNVQLRTGPSVTFPFWVAYSAIPDDLPLRYFNRWYVKLVLSSRIELHIVSQSEGNSPTERFAVGKLTHELANLNEFDKKGLLKGLGDIDMLGHCDISRQFQQKPARVQIGQTLDRGLHNVLLGRDSYCASVKVNTSDPNRDQRIKEAAELMLSNPFVEEDKRAKQIRINVADFSDVLEEICNSAWNVAC